MAFKLNGKTLPIDRGFTHNEITYPRQWLRQASEENRTALGITWEADPVRADDRYYWNGELDNPKALEDREESDINGSPLWVQELNNSDPENPVMVDTNERLVTKGLKSNMIAQVKNIAGTMLASTDWYVTRKIEKNINIPSNIISKRETIRTECNRLEKVLGNVATIEALIDAMNNQKWED